MLEKSHLNREKPVACFLPSRVIESALLTLLALTACGGGSGGSGGEETPGGEAEESPQNQPPSANAGADQIVPAGTLVTLDGSGSLDPDQDPLIYSWGQISGPPVSLSKLDDVQPTFQAPDQAVQLLFELTVSDGQDTSSDTVQIDVTGAGGGNQPPIANAGADQVASAGSLVILDGAASSDPDNDPLTYSWRQISGISVTLSDSMVVQPTFTTPNQTAQLDFELSVSDGVHLPETDTVKIDVTLFQGFGAVTEGGAGGEVYHVTSLADNGPGTLRDAAHQYNGTNRYVVFDVAGTITLLNDIIIRGHHLTIDGSTAPPPGITIRKTTIHDGEFLIAGTHDIIITHLRFWGLWQLGGPNSNNASTISIDGDSGPDYIARNIVLDHITARNATDGGPDIWGEISDLTVSWCFFFYNWHPTTISHYPAPYQTRQRISMHHNVYAKNSERQPQLRGDVRDFDYVNNVVYDWAYFQPSWGYGVRIKNQWTPGEPQVNANFINNYFLPTIHPSWALVYGSDPGPDSKDGGPSGPAPPQGTVITTSLMGDLYVSGNILPPENKDHYSTIASPLPIPVEAQVPTYPAEELKIRVLPTVGMKFRDAEEQAILEEIQAAMEGN